MRIAIINQPWNTADLPVRSGSIAIWNYQVARRLAGRCEVIVYARRKPGQPAEETHEGVHYRRVSIALDRRVNLCLAPLGRLWPTRRPYFASRFYYGSYIRRVVRDLVARQPDVVHLHNLTQYVPAIRRRLPGAKILLHMHSEWLDQLSRPMLAKRLALCDRIVGCSNHLAEQARRRFPWFAGRVRALHNGVDVGVFAPRGMGVSAVPRFTILYVGRLSPEKGLHDLLDAFALVRAARPESKLTLVGPDVRAPSEFIVALSSDPHVRALAKYYRCDYLAQLRSHPVAAVGDCVEFAGSVEHPHLAARYQAATLLVNPSLSETFGMSLIEAMACGCPVVATAVGGMAEVVVPGQTGLLCPPAQPRRLAQALLELLDDPARAAAMGQAGRRRAAELFSWEHIADRTFDCYQELCP